ncbi:MAG: efflux RND transporter periplasmic adaptor subunit, partial [Methylococcaceae bacterium]
MSSSSSSTEVFTSQGRFRLGLVGLILGLGYTLAHGFSTRQEEQSRRAEWTQQHALPSVAVIHPAHRKEGEVLELPGRLEAVTEASIYARVSGYLKNWNADMGKAVKAGQLLAEIETPELDQQLLQARAEVATAEAESRLAGSTAKRWHSLLNSDSISRQEADEKSGMAAVKQAVLQSAKANLERYTALKNFTRIVAPFDGRVTARNTDQGALITVGTGSKPLFVIADTRTLRCYVGVPQVHVPAIREGTLARLSVPERPHERFTARVAAISGAVNAASGTSLIQLEVDNSGGLLLPGGYVHVRLDIPKAGSALTLPVSALIVDGRGAQVASVDNTGKV